LSVPFSAISPVTIQLSSSSATGQFLDSSGKVLPHSSLTIPAGSSSAQIEYKDSQAGIPTLSASLDGTSTPMQVNVGVSLGFTTPARNLQAGQTSQPITVQLQDSHGKAVIAQSPLNLFLGSNSSTGEFLDSQGNFSSGYWLIPAGSSCSFTFTYKDSVGGRPTLTVSVPALGFLATQQETVAGPYQVRVGVPPTVTVIAQNTPSQPIAIQLFDSTGNLAAATSAVTVQLTSSSSSGQFLDAAGKVLTNGRLTIPAGSSFASFLYKDSQAGFPTLTISANGYKFQQQLNVGVSLVFTTPAQTLRANQPSGTITVQLQDSHGKAVNAPSDLFVYVNSNTMTGSFLDSQGNPLFPYAGFSIPAGSSSVSFKYKDIMGGKPALTASAASMSGMGGMGLSASQQETVAGPYQARVGMPPPAITPNQPSQPIAIQLFDSTGILATATSAVTVQLSSSSRSGQFLDASGKVLANGRLTIPAGSSSASFEYKDSTAGFPTLTIAANGTTALLQVNVGVSLVFTTPAQNLKAGQTSKPITVQLQDSHGKAIAVPSTFGLSLESNSRTGNFVDTFGNPLFYLSIPAGSSSVTFLYKDSTAGAPTISAQGFSIVGISISATQKESVTGPFNLVFATFQQAPIVPNRASQPFTIQLLDSTWNVVKAPSAQTVQLSSSSSTGQFLDASGKVLANGRLTIPAGASSASFAYKDSTAGLPTLTIAANGVTSQQQVNVGVSLVFSTPAQNLKAGQTSQSITVQLQDAKGKAINTPTGLDLYLNSSLNTVQFLNLYSNMGPASIYIPAGSSSASFAFTSSWGGKPILTASLTSLPPMMGSPPNLQLLATQQETIQGLSALMFTTAPQTVTAGQKSQRVTLQLEDNNGKAASAPSGGLAINLSGNSLWPYTIPTLTFFDVNGNSLPISGNWYGTSSILFMPAGSSTVSFEFESTQTGSVPLYVSLSNGYSTSQTETVQAGPPHSLVFKTPPQALPTNVPTGSITVQLQDQYGNPVAAGSGGLTFTLHSSSSGGAFLSADGDPLAGSSITIPQGLSSATFEYKDSRAGTPTLTASAKGVSATQTESITPVSAEIHVTNTTDSGNGSLRAAIAAANAHPGSTIVFDAGVKGTIDLLSALPPITAKTNILGPGANVLTIERSAAATADFGIFVVGVPTSATQPTVVLSGLTVANATGSGITNYGYLTVQRMVVKNNQAPAYISPTGEMFPYGSSGGIGNSGALTVLNSTIANNGATSSTVAAGIDSENGSVLIVNSTISGNRGVHTYRPGGIGIDGGTALIENSTISGNTTIPWFVSTNNSGGITSDGQVMLYDTIVAGNSSLANNVADVSGAFLSLGHNLIGAANPLNSGFVSTDRVGTLASSLDPKLGPLQDNGGPTPTMALLTGSPALAAGSSIDAAATDQRGHARPQQGAIDIGAFEVTGE